MLKDMMRISLLFSLLALNHGQLIYPDQYEYMKTLAYGNPNSGRASQYPFVTYSTPQISYSSLSDQMFNKEYTSFDATQSAQSDRRHFLGTQIPIYSSTIGPPQSLPQDLNNHISKGITKFALNLDKAIYNTSRTVNGHRENVIFSPLSIGVALYMILLGSAGRTFDEVSQVLGFQPGTDISRHSEVVHQMFGSLLNVINYRKDNSPRINLANGIFVQKGYPIRPEFKAISENVYKSEVINLDFLRQGEEAKEIINNWVKQQTMGKITSILDNLPNALTKVILLSALYFKGEWNQHFMDGATRRKEFFIEPNQPVKVDMMYNGGLFPFYEDKSLNVKILALPYKGLEMSMYILLPKAEGANELKKFQDFLTPEIIENLISNLKEQTCIIGLPRMKLSSSVKLNRALQSLGLRSLFSAESSDLSLLSNGYSPNQPNSFTSQQIPLSVSQVTSQTRPQARPQAIPQARPQAIPQARPHVTPQARPQIAQSSSQAIPQARPHLTPQARPQIAQTSSQALPHTIPQSLPQALPQTMPQSLPQISPQADSKSLNNYLIFSRAGEQSNPGIADGVKKNYFRYDDKIRGINVEQWNTGFHIRRHTRNAGRYDKISQLTYDTEYNKKEDSHVITETNDDNMKYISLEENKYRFEDAKRINRKKRQSRPIDESFLEVIRTNNFPSYGLDNLRNSASLINPGLFASEVRHKVEMDITETGTEAAAITAVLLERDGNQKRLIANRPFLFFIRHDPSKLILFWGTVNQPTPNFAVVR